MEMETSCESSKRSKAHVNNITHCLVDACTADLSLCRDYHRRHKVCEIHSKTPKVTIGGREQRFCQQCSRFHSLVEFDEGKRSCRKRLDGHNRRRRKPPPQPDSNSGLVFSTQPAPPTGTGSLLSFSTPQQILATNSILSSSWTAGVVKSKAAADMMLYDQQQNYNEHSYKAVNQLQFQFIHDANAAVDSDRALSLLSPPESVHNYFHHYPFDDQESKPPINATDSHIPGMMFQSAEEGSSSSTAPHQTLSFMWE
ncbi:hypothetical protein ACS0TY_009180 [Phlomoides rotata]